MIGRHFSEIVGGDAYSLDKPLMDRGGGANRDLQRFTESDQGQDTGTGYCWCPTKDSSGRVLGLYMLGVGISDIKRTKPSSRAKRNFAWQWTVAADGYIDASYRYQLINRRVEEMFGKTREQLVGRDLKNSSAKGVTTMLSPVGTAPWRVRR